MNDLQAGSRFDVQLVAPPVVSLPGQSAQVAELIERLEQSERELRFTSALLDILSQVASAGDVRQGCYVLVNEMQQLLGCTRVAVGLCRSRTRCSVQAISGLAKFDKNSQILQAISASLDEAMLRGAITCWPAREDEPRFIAQRNLCRVTGSERAVSAPLRDTNGKIVGAWVLLGPDDWGSESGSIHSVRACERPVGSCLDLLGRSAQTRLARWMRKCVASRKRLLITAALVLLGILLCPLPYKVGAKVELQPVKRRFVAAPYDGTLEQTCVEPGDLVAQGQVLARMDGREMRLKMAELLADRGRAGKDRDVNLAGQNISAAQIAELEMQRVDLQMEQLEHRQEHLEIKSPLDGIVIKGDLKRAEGVTLTIGESLFEIAPLDRMIGELALQSEDLAHVKPGQQVVVKLESFPARTFRGTIVKLHPCSEIRNEQNVFLAETILDNQLQLLRPGMKGHAKITTQRHTLFWNLFHKSWENLLLMLGW